jgi:hypothetical protein
VNSEDLVEEKEQRSFGEEEDKRQDDLLGK